MLSKKNFIPILLKSITRNGKKRGKFILILSILSLLTGTLFAQGTEEIFEKRYEEALLDSAIRYEALKPVTFHLQLENKHLIQANLELRILVDLRDKQRELIQKKYNAQLADLRKGATRRFLIGTAVGALGTLIILKL
ncbi:hypothetical protein [Dyadobacter sp. LHD-138]|uniref:hypothetical protein n=1 Tax=Dyadobacter sp. LHD-138 TaxID=3071413 RepID=UPI0027DFBD0E|nr:hypothetical protein [Dyadobacter sp. LHD-138]MDQ6479788.1 hypothetical protein [Dyadobacter sp. LHD-138]